ncbi:MAG: TIR domain-containing protein [Hyphomonadaceae bacterium]|nr:TIR domain-containing protein [Hyphomonadaceae bacterium]
MARRVFFSFYYSEDAWRTSQVRNIGALEGNRPCTDNEWQRVLSGGDAAIRRWIDNELAGKSCTIVLIGSQTAYRPWVQYEIQESWRKKKALFGINIHGLYDQKSQPSLKGSNPFLGRGLADTYGRTCDWDIPVYDPSGWYSTDKYKNIADNIEHWIDDAIARRARWG